MKTRNIAALVAACAAAACTTVQAPATVEADFGNSVRSVIEAQTANPATLTNPSSATVTGVDAEYGNNVVEAMRKDVPKPEEVKRPIVMQVGGWNSN
ncbi:MAG: hypothetical protein RL261_1121 [Pseudomonadota bacterium]|jgi:type IV pilus biogenesis protein CpaD/CtpE